MKVLMIDDDQALCKMMQEYFELEDIHLDFCYTGKTWPVLLKRHSYDAVILDLSLPEISGLTILKKIVDSNDIPVLLLTAQGSDLDHITSLEIGAEDYLDKPCNPQVLISRIKKVLMRRKLLKHNETQEEIRVGDLEISPHTRRVLLNQVEIKLTVTEFKILEMLAKQPGKGFTKNELSLHALGRKNTEFDRSLDAHIYKLRKKIENVPESNLNLQTVYGYGYKLEQHV
jgi:DNA-binding response OmpR family regulator